MTRLVLEKPTRETRGFLRRQKRALELKKAMLDPQPETVDEVIEFLLPFVTEPVEREAAREALWDASEAQFDELLGAVAGVPSGSPL